MNKETFRIINPSTLYNPTPNAYSHIAVVQNFKNIIHIAGQGGEDSKGELSPNFEEQATQVFNNIQNALTAAEAKISDIAVLRVLIVDHSDEKHQILIKIMQNLWKNHPFPACTLIPVPRLALERMLIEVEATAYT
ncbi:MULTISPECIES: RidA family protein [Acinetobacter]|jgi:enamine deaminase RidA (YjgF/YER057c/UK114 family)|uniref:YjgF family translation initiation inhibitor n=4 Tax=Acinetobacter nosocomialis TaxID=106654 RepID=A0A2T7FPF4_ACINO|nr:MULTISPECIES: RidA family protein [Acinetobacter]KCX92142.1 endoribonuclease L-PSP family protein [Acinetobacter baumannii 6112]KCY47968.1 endoribonuclease L-PSP family protein [Acinetobacter baumannii 1571545]KCZ31094.1 endoribonuclease L-PSP family protein [Acinetobacter baumannii 25977_9]MDQ9825064.1 RidA family protein [Acinetobacter sp. 163]SSQ33457.1 putative flavin-containing amine oxidase [Acinetobacter baumannii]